MECPQAVSKRLPRFLRDESGSFTLEVMIWSPLLIGTLLLILDFSYLMMVNAGMWNASRDTARAVSIHRVTPDNAEQYLRDRLFLRRGTYDVTVDVTSSEVVARVTVDSAEAALTPVVGRYIIGQLAAKVVMLREPE